MIRLALLTALLVAPGGAAGCMSSTPPGASGDWVELSADGLPAAIASRCALAAKRGKKPFVYLHASWCGPCRAIESTRRQDPAMRAAFARATILAVDIDRVPAATLEKLGLGARAIPVFFRMTAAGKPTGEKIDGGAWGENSPKDLDAPGPAL